MANEFAKSPWILDTAAVIRTDPVLIKRMEYHPAATGNTVTIEDADGDISWTRTAVYDASSDGVQVWDQEAIFDGFELAVISAGTLYVWV